MFKLLLRAFVITLGLIGPAMAQQRILISSHWGKATAELVDNNATTIAGPDAATHDRNARPPPSGKDRQSAFALARGRAAPDNHHDGEERRQLDQS
jgi:hypothetical protein